MLERKITICPVCGSREHEAEEGHSAEEIESLRGENILATIQPIYDDEIHEMFEWLNKDNF